MWCRVGLTNGGVGVIDLTCIQTRTFYTPPDYSGQEPADQSRQIDFLMIIILIDEVKGAVRKYFIELVLLKIFTITNKLSLFLSN